MRLTAALLCVIATIAPSIAVEAGEAGSKYHITAAEKAACTFDAVRFCSGAYPDEDLLLACMRQNRTALSRACLVAFDAGLRRRRL